LTGRAAADLSLAGNEPVIRPVLVDPGAEAGRVHGKGHVFLFERGDVGRSFGEFAGRAGPGQRGDGRLTRPRAALPAMPRVQTLCWSLRRRCGFCCCAPNNCYWLPGGSVAAVSVVLSRWVCPYPHFGKSKVPLSPARSLRCGAFSCALCAGTSAARHRKQLRGSAFRQWLAAEYRSRFPGSRRQAPRRNGEQT
jgi:hypothetical protein